MIYTGLFTTSGDLVDVFEDTNDAVEELKYMNDEHYVQPITQEEYQDWLNENFFPNQV